MPNLNLGYKINDMEAQPEGGDKNKTYYPSIHLSTKNIEGLELKVGQEVKLVGVVAGRDEHKRNDEKKDVSYDIEIRELNKGMSEEEYADLSDDEKDNADEKSIKDKSDE